MQRWEYDLLTFEAEGGRLLDRRTMNYAAMRQTLNTLGRQGWEVISTLTATTDLGTVQSVTVMLKRLLPS